MAFSKGAMFDQVEVDYGGSYQVGALGTRGSLPSPFSIAISIGFTPIIRFPMTPWCANGTCAGSWTRKKGRRRRRRRRRQGRRDDVGGKGSPGDEGVQRHEVLVCGRYEGRIATASSTFLVPRPAQST